MLSENQLDIYVLLFRIATVGITTFSHNYIATFYSFYYREDYEKSHYRSSVVGYNFNIIITFLMYVVFYTICEPMNCSFDYLYIIAGSFLKTMLLETMLILIFNVVGSEDSCMNNLIRKLHFPSAMHDKYVDEYGEEDSEEEEEEEEEEDNFRCCCNECACKNCNYCNKKCIVKRCCCSKKEIVNDNEIEENVVAVENNIEYSKEKRKRRTKAEMIEYRNANVGDIVDEKK
ncbi:MAG: hypothetical protein ACRCX2_18475 [Paraclostridium sp.]